MEARKGGLGPSRNPKARSFHEQWVRDKAFWWVQFSSQQLFGIVGILAAAIIALYSQLLFERRRRKDGIRLSQGNRVSKIEVLLPVETAVLAKNDPKILTAAAHVLPHSLTQFKNTEYCARS